MLANNKLFFVTWILVLMMIAATALACETDVCTQRLNAYIECQNVDFAICEIHRKAAEKACGI